MNRSNDILWTKVLIGLLSLLLMAGGCAGRVGQKPATPQPPPSSVEWPSEGLHLNFSPKTVNNFIRHRIRPGETLSDIAMRHYDTFLTEVYYSIQERALISRAMMEKEKTSARRIGIVSEVIQRMNDLDSSRLPVGKEIWLPEIRGLDFLTKQESEEISAVRNPKAEPIPPPSQKTSETPEEPATTQPADEQVSVTPPEKVKRAPETEEIPPEKPPAAPPSRHREIFFQNLMRKGQTLFEQEKYLPAVETFKAALEQKPDCEECQAYLEKSQERYMDIHYKEGLRYFEEEQLKNAIDSWKQVQQIDPKYRNVQKNMDQAERLLQTLEQMEKKRSPEAK